MLAIHVYCVVDIVSIQLMAFKFALNSTWRLYSTLASCILCAI